MAQIHSLHTYCNSRYYAIVLPIQPTKESLLDLDQFMKEKIGPKIGALHVHYQLEPMGMFVNLSNDYFNGKVKETCDHALIPKEDYDEIRPWQKYDYVNEVYVDWYGPMMTKGLHDPEFKKNSRFGYKSSFQSSLNKSGIVNTKIPFTYLFSIIDLHNPGNELPLPQDVCELLRQI